MQSQEIEEKTYYERSLVSKALYAALMAHGGQEDRDGIPYFHHLLRVGAAMSPDPEAVIVGLLHDLLEDTENTKEDVEKIFGFSIAEQVNILTRDESESYWDYIDKLIDESVYYPKALLVKRADLLDNLAPWRQDFLGAESLSARHRVALRMVEHAMIDRGLLDESQRYVGPDAPRASWSAEIVDEFGGAPGVGGDEVTEPAEVSPGTLGSLLAAFQARQFYNDNGTPAEPSATPAAPDPCSSDDDLF